MNSLTPSQHKMYSDYIDYYNKSGSFKIMSLDAFLNSQLEKQATLGNRKIWTDLYQVTLYAQNDY